MFQYLLLFNNGRAIVPTVVWAEDSPAAQGIAEQIIDASDDGVTLELVQRLGAAKIGVAEVR